MFHAKYGAVCIHLTDLCFDLCEDTCTVSHYQNEIISMTHLRLFKFKSWNNGMCCVSFYVVISFFTFLF